MQTTKLYKGKIEIDFDENRHIFYKNAKSITSVTAVTGIVDKSRPLIFWAVKLAKEFLINNWDVQKKITELEKLALLDEAARQHTIRKEAAATIGDLIHQWASDHILKEKPEIPDDEQVRNGVIAFLSWVKKSKIKFDSSERVVYSKKYNFAGILDATGKIDGKPVIIDFKSSKGIYNEMRYQLAAYWFADQEESGKKYDRGYIVQFGKESGEFNALEISRQEYQKDFRAFLGALLVKTREKELTKYGN